MKNVFKVLGIIVLAVIIGFIVVACDDNKKCNVCNEYPCVCVTLCEDCDGEDCDCNEEPEVRGPHGDDTPIPFSHGEVLIKGENLYPSEWQGLTNTIIAALNADAAWANYFGEMIDVTYNFYGENITIVVKNTDEFDNYSTTVGGHIIYINLNTEDLITSLQNAFMALEGGADEIG